MKNNKPIISIIVPVYQVEDYIENTMRSICKQSFKEFEVILVDDGTRDRSISRAIKILENNAVIFSVIQQQNKGLPAARNTGIRNAEGEWVVSVDSDDTISENFLEILYKGCIKNNVLVAIGKFQSVYSKNIFKKPKYYDNHYEVITQEECIKRFLNREFKPHPCTILWNKEYLERRELFYNEKVQFSEDQELMWRLFFDIDRIVYNKTPIYNYLQRDNSIMTAPKVNKIMTGFNAISKIEVPDSINTANLRQTLIARWVLGAMHAYARNGGYDGFSELADKMDYKKQMKNLFSFEDKKISGLSHILHMSKKLGYYCLKKI